MNECSLCKKSFDGQGTVCPECAEKIQEKPVVIAKEPEREFSQTQTEAEINESTPIQKELPEQAGETTSQPETAGEAKPESQPQAEPEPETEEKPSALPEEKKTPPERKPPEKREPEPKMHKFLRFAYSAANPYPALKKNIAPLWFLALFPAIAYLMTFAHIAWDKIALSYLPAEFLLVYLPAGICAGLIFTAAGAALTTGFCLLFRTGKTPSPLTLTGAMCLPELYTALFSLLGLFFRMFGWGSIVFAPTAALLPLCFLLPFWLRVYKGKQLPVILSVFLSGILRIGILHIFLSLKF